MATPLPLEGDGLVDNLFHLLWAKDDFGDGPTLYVPHTVVYKFGQPAAWYFTSLRTGRIKKKNKANVTNLQIEHEFTKHQRGGPHAIVACYLYKAQRPQSSPHHRRRHQQHPEGDDEPNHHHHHHSGTDETAAVATDDGPATVIEYLDAAQLHAFLFTRDKADDGILQRFVLPKGTSNATIRAIWSPKICLLERRVNAKNLHDPRFSVYERGVTFDGGGAGELFSRAEPVRGAMLPGEVQLLCERIVEHVTQVSYHKYRISRMVLHLKADADDRLWLLWCSSLRLVQPGAGATATRPLDIVSDAQVPAHVSLGRVSHAAANSPLPPRGRLQGSKSTPALRLDDPDAPLREGFQRCTSCAMVVEQSRMLTTHYKAVLEHFERFLAFLRRTVNEREHAAIAWPPDAALVAAAGGVGFGILPFCERPPPPPPASPVGASTSPTVLSSPTRSAAGGLRAKDLLIPPVIQFLHPQLSAEDFARHRHDPIFLHKPVAVCEPCCLVYSDYTTTALEANSLRPNVPAILRPQREVPEPTRRLDPVDPIRTTTTTASPERPGRPPASAWRPIPLGTGAGTTTASSKSLTKHPGHDSGPRATFPPAPQLPERVESLVEWMQQQEQQQAPPSSVDPRMREESFFRELYHQHGDMQDGHPLQHMLASSTRLAEVTGVKRRQLAAIRDASGSRSPRDETGGGALTTLGKSSSLSALDSLLDRHQLAQRKTNPYKQVQKLRAPETDKRRRQTHRRRRERQQQQQPTPSDDDDGDDPRASSSSPDAPRRRQRPAPNHHQHGGNQSPPRRFISSREALASEAHQDFLFAALHDAEQQLEALEQLAPIVLPSLEAAAAASSRSLPTADELAGLLSENASLGSS